METTKTLYPATAEKVASLRAELKSAGVRGARVCRMPNGALRVVLASASDREAARDAFVMVDACTASGYAFTSTETKHAWNGPTEIFIRFLYA